MNVKQKRLTVIELRKIDGFTNCSEEEAEAIISTLEKISLLFFYQFQNKKRLEENFKIIKLNNTDNNEQRKAA